MSMLLLCVFVAVFRFLMADDKGKVCSTKELDFYTGCCKEGQTHTCDK